MATCAKNAAISILSFVRSPLFANAPNADSLLSASHSPEYEYRALATCPAQGGWNMALNVTKPMGSSLSSRAQVVVLVAPPLLAVLPPEPVLPPAATTTGVHDKGLQKNVLTVGS